MDVIVTRDGRNQNVKVKWQAKNVHVHNGSFTLTEDGDYEITIRYVDRSTNEMKEYVYPDFLPVLQILSQDTVKQYNDVKTSGEATVNLNELAEKLITNPVIQKVEVLEGDHMIHLTNAQSIINSIKNFLYSI